jgi:type I restriction enzyme S subunit
MIPDGWSIEPLSELARVQGGNAFKSALFGEIGVPVVRISAIQAGNVSLQDAPLHPYDAGLNRFELADDDILIAMSGATTGKLGRYRKMSADERAYLNQRVGRFQPKSGDRRDLDFCWYILQTERVQTAILGDSIGGAQPNVSGGEIERILVKVPPPTERWEIANTLRTWDRAIETVEALIANARAQKQALMQQLLPRGTTPPKKRLPGFSGEWRTLRIGDVAKEISERAGEEAGYPVLSCSKYDGMVESLTYFKKKVYSDDTSNYKVMRRGTFGFPSNHIEEGSIGYQDLFDAGIVSPIYCVFVTDAQVDNGFLYKLLKTDRYRQIFAAATNASVDRRGSLRWKEFSRIPLPLPQLEEQRAINEAVNAVADVERGYETQLTALRQEKAALMQQLLTGKRRVKLPESEVV